MKHIRDPLYGYISVSEDELRVIGAPQVQRLRRVHQLGLSSAVYPGATHTRFEHSLGVMHLAGQLAESLDLSEGEVQSYRYAGLLHDVGHAPFSHAIEDVMEQELGIAHEDRSCIIVDDLAEDGYLPSAVNPELVKAAIQGESEYDIVAGAVDGDRMDYLRRDAFETGLEHGNIDTQTIIRFAEIRDDDVVFSHKCIQALEGLFTARFHMSKSVYEHHTSKIVETMLQRAVEDYLATEDTPIETILGWDDFQLHTYLMGSSGMSKRLYTRIANRDLYKRALILGENDIGRDLLTTLANDLEDVHAYEREIADRAGVTPEEVILDPPRPPTGTSPDVGIIWNDEVRPLTEVSALPSTITDSEWRNATLGVYAPKECRDEVAAAAEAVLF